MEMKKSKYFIILIIVIICVITLVCLVNKNNKEKSGNNIEITKEEYENIKIKNIKDKLGKAGIKLTEEQSTRRKGTKLKGYSYKVDEEPEKIEIYILDFKQRREIIGEDVSDGIVMIEIDKEKEEAILSEDILITNIKDSNLKTRIMNALK